MLDREFGEELDLHERALSRLAGGIANKGHQCGMLWGSAMGVGAEAFRRSKDTDEAIGLALAATRQVVQSFEDRTKTVNCREVTGHELDTFTGMLGMIFDTLRDGMDDSRCFVLAEDWTPEAIAAARAGLDAGERHGRRPRSCASEVVRKMGGSEEDSAMAAGFAGGIGLSGHGCGALGAAMWMKGLQWCRAHPGKSPGPWTDTGDKAVLEAFGEATGGEFPCWKICGQRFASIDEHARFIDEGGCAELIETLARS